MAADTDLNTDDFDATAALGGAGEPPTESSLFQEAREAGIEFGEDIKDDAGLTRFLLQQYTEQKPYAEYGRSALSQPESGRDHAEPDPKPNADNQPEQFDEHKFFSEAWNVPALSPGAKWALSAGAFKEGKGGLLEPAPGLEQAALPYIKEINDYQRARAQLHDTFSDNPVKFMADKLLPYLEHKFGSRFQQQSQQSFQEYESRNFVEKFRSENASWLYNQAGNEFTPQGLRFNETVQELTASGWPIDRAIQFTSKLMPPPVKDDGNTATTAAGAPHTEPKAARERNADGTFAKPKPPAAPPKPKSFLEKAKERATVSHSQVGRKTAEDVVVHSDGELDEMWSQAYHEHTAGAV